MVFLQYVRFFVTACPHGVYIDLHLDSCGVVDFVGLAV